MEKKEADFNIFNVVGLKITTPKQKTLNLLKEVGDFVEGVFIEAEKAQINKYGNNEIHISLLCKDRKIIKVPFYEKNREKFINEISKIKPGQIIKICLTEKVQSKDTNKSPFKVFLLENEEKKIDWNFLKTLAYMAMIKRGQAVQI